MMYGYDLYGWFTGEVPEGTERATATPPPECAPPFRANWQGNYWFIDEYKAPIVTEPVTEDPLQRILADPELVEALKALLK